MMRVSFVLLYLLITIAVLYDNVKSEGTCESFTTEEDCCKQTNCTFIQCVATNSTDNHTGCHEPAWNSTDTCKPDTLKQLCRTSGSTTVAPTDAPVTTAAPTPGPCANLNNTACCDNTEECKYISCNSTDTTQTELHKGCHLKDDTLENICQPDTEKNICETPTTTAAPVPSPTSNPTSKPQTEAPGSTTQAPGPDPCLEFTGNASNCCSKADLKCMYVVCQGIDKAPHLGCHVNTTDLSAECTENTVVNICIADEWVPKDDPGSGGEDQGQHFDGASFIGGIVLCMGLVVIIFCGQKVYRARAEKNYHTL